MRKLILASIFIFGLCIFFTPRLPFIDYPDWIYQGNILHGIFTSDSLFTNEFKIVSPFVPNSLVTILIGLLSYIISPDLAGRILVITSALIMFLGLKGLYGDSNKLLAESLALIFMPAIFLFMGLISFYLGLGLFLFFISWLKTSRKPLVTILKYSISLIILYYTHFLPFLLISLWFLTKSLFYKDKYTPRFKELIPGFLITGILTLAYIISSSSTPSGSTIWAYHPLSKITGFFRALSVFYEFNDLSSFPNLLILIGLNLIWVFSFLFLLFYWTKGSLRAIVKDPKFVFGAACLVLGLFTPLLINGFGYNSELRFYWVGFMFIAGAAFAASVTISNKVVYIIAFFAIFTLFWRSFIIVTKGIEDHKFESTISSIIPVDESFQPVMIAYSFPEYYPFRPGIQKRIAALCEQVSDINRIPLYLLLDRHEIYRDIFKTGIIRCKYPACDVRALIENPNLPCEGDCSKLLFICSRGFTDSFRTILTRRFSVNKEGSNFILASPLSVQSTKNAK